MLEEGSFLNMANVELVVTYIEVLPGFRVTEPGISIKG